MKCAALIGILGLLATFSYARAGQVIDLGTLEIDGDLRRPMLQYFDTNRSAQEAAKELVMSEISSTEMISLMGTGNNKRMSKTIEQRKTLLTDLKELEAKALE